MTYVEAEIPRFEAYKLITYSYRRYTEEDAERFKNWVVLHDWSGVLATEGPNCKARAYQRDINAAMDAFFPVRTTTR